MKRIFWLAVIGFILFEIANVYFIMPMPGSQQMNSIDAAYFLYKWRWVFRGLFAVLMIIGLLKSNWKRKWVPVIPIVLLAIVILWPILKWQPMLCFNNQNKSYSKLLMKIK